MQGLRAFWHYFKRRALRQKLQETNLQALLCTQDLDSARGARSQLDAEAPPEFAGLSIEARRAINLAAVGYAQILCDRLVPTALLEPARVAAGRREPPRDDYGDRARCEATMAQIARARGSTAAAREPVAGDQAALGSAAASLAKYRNESDTVPVADSLSTAIDGSKVLTDDMWEIYRVLLR